MNLVTSACFLKSGFRFCDNQSHFLFSRDYHHSCLCFCFHPLISVSFLAISTHVMPHKWRVSPPHDPAQNESRLGGLLRLQKEMTPVTLPCSATVSWPPLSVARNHQGGCNPQLENPCLSDIQIGLPSLNLHWAASAECSRYCRLLIGTNHLKHNMPILYQLH